MRVVPNAEQVWTCKLGSDLAAFADVADLKYAQMSGAAEELHLVLNGEHDIPDLGHAAARSWLSTIGALRM